MCRAASFAFSSSVASLPRSPSGSVSLIGLFWQKPYRFNPSGEHHNGAKPDVFTESPEGVVIGNWGR